MTSWCPRCGNVGFHSEACIKATSDERIAAQGMATLHDCSMAREEAFAAGVAAARADRHGLEIALAHISIGGCDADRDIARAALAAIDAIGAGEE